MEFLSQRIPYRETKQFSRIVLDHIDQAEPLRPFYAHAVSRAGFEAAIRSRQSFHTDRETLYSHLQEQYKGLSISEKLIRNLEDLRSANSFTITTAHQPNLFTGPLYVIYKILHAIQLARHLSEQFPDKKFIPVYYMGSEDADLDELGHLFLNGEKLNWDTTQTGAVGRMKVDKGLLKLIDQIAGQEGVQPYGAEIVDILKQCFKQDISIQQGTFHFLHQLFGEWGLVVLIADAPALKKKMIPVFQEDLLAQTPSQIVEQSSARLGKEYKVQASPRAINLFYMVDGIRNRIETSSDGFQVVDTEIRFTKEALLKELDQYPERFSPNVILRGLYQETILPNIAFIGGGGELAYWLQLKELFTHYKVPYPMLVLRNSFLVVEKSWVEKINKTGFDLVDFFQPLRELMDRYVTRASINVVRLNGTLTDTEAIFDRIKSQAGAVDPTLANHTEAIKVQAVKKLKELEKKMLRAEKRKFADQQRQLSFIKDRLFPGEGLQERVDNFIPYYAKWGRGFLQALLDHTQTIEQEFTILTER
ncbi:MAG: bacillithiol biosynthesis cysteine-adding enzyme BshC [Chitinophagales bacterium]|nr:bacillithiol biosynthesis cysteine-adding enzyme BshC [Chitinophagales bacterium]